MPVFSFPASPETWELLQSYGWSCMPHKAGADQEGAGDNGHNGSGGGGGGGEKLAGEFNAES
jgi:hypothetical protein